MDTVSIIIPAHNAEHTLVATLDSALSQSGVAEILVNDDGSSDNTLAVARRYEPHVQVLTGPNRGASAARNRGIAESSAQWLIFLDSDDLLTPGTLELRLSPKLTEQADVIICDWEDFLDADSETVCRRSVDWEFLRSDPELATATSVWATTAAILYRRSIVESIGGFRDDLPVIQDARLLFDAARLGARFAYSEHVGARYRIVEGSLSRRDPSRFWRDVLLNGTQIEALWRGVGEVSAVRLEALAGIYNNAARGLFRAGDPAYFEAVARQRALGLPLPRHSCFAPPLARAFGLRVARRLAALAGAS